MLIQDQAPPAPSIVVTTTVTAPPTLTEEGPSTTFETGGSSAVPEYSPTRPLLDDASIRLARHLAQHSPKLSSRGKGISIEEGRSGDNKTLVAKTQEEIGILKQKNIEKDIKLEQNGNYITELQAENALKT